MTTNRIHIDKWQGVSVLDKLTSEKAEAKINVSEFIESLYYMSEVEFGGDSFSPEDIARTIHCLCEYEDFNKWLDQNGNREDFKRWLEESDLVDHYNLKRLERSDESES